MAARSRILAWQILWTEEPGVSYSPWDHKKVGHDLATEQQQLTLKYLLGKNTDLFPLGNI